MPLLFVRDNIVHMTTDAIVNAANTALRPGGGVCGSIFDWAGFEAMQLACQKIDRCPVGDAVITPGFALPAKFVIHTVGPVWQGGHHQEETLPRSCYTRSLNLAKEYGLEQTEETFSQTLIRLIDQRGEKDSAVYNRANIDRRLFSKIRSNPNYKPSKQTVLAFCVALELSLEETRELLGKAGLALTHTSKFDIIAEYFISRQMYDIFEINQVLFQFDQPLLGSQ